MCFGEQNLRLAEKRQPWKTNGREGRKLDMRPRVLGLFDKSKGIHRKKEKIEKEVRRAR